MTPCEELGYYVGDTFRITKLNYRIPYDTIVTLKKDDRTHCPLFIYGNSIQTYITLSNLHKVNPLQTGYSNVTISQQKNTFVLPTIPMITPLLTV